MARNVLVLVVTIALLAVAGGGVAAQTPPAATPTPVPLGPLYLKLTSPGVYQLSGIEMARAAPYRVSASVFGIGSDTGVVVDVGQGEYTDDRFAVDLRLPLDQPLGRMNRAGCYHVRFWAGPDPNQIPPPYPGASLAADACVDAAGNTTFPAFDGVQSPPPAAPSDVRIEPLGDDWKITWRDNSTDEIAFKPGVLLFGRPWSASSSDATLLGSMDLPEVAADWTVIGGLRTYFAPTGPPEVTCGYALVLVFAVGGDGPSLLPGNTTVPACFGGGQLSFPPTGAGGARAGWTRARAATVLLGVAGAVGVAGGLALRTRRRRGGG